MTGHRLRAGKDGSYSRTRRIVGLMYIFFPSMLFSSVSEKKRKEINSQFAGQVRS